MLCRTSPAPVLFNLHSMSSATFQDPDTFRDNGSQRHLKPLEITGPFGCGLIGTCDPQLLFLIVSESGHGYVRSCRHIA